MASTVNKDSDSTQLEVELQTLTAEILALAANHQGNCLALLTLLRILEQVHREIRENWFQSSLPDNRQALYALLKDIEEMGGWPYIDRLRLRSLLANVPPLTDSTDQEKSED